MPEHESGGADNDRLSGRQREARAARVDQDHPRGASPDPGASANHDAQVASEAMSAETLSSLGDAARERRAPPGRQVSGDPPAV